MAKNSLREIRSAKTFLREAWEKQNYVKALYGNHEYHIPVSDYEKLTGKTSSGKKEESDVS